MSKTQVYTQIDRPDSFFPLFSGIFGNDFSWEKITVFLDSARNRPAPSRSQEGGRPVPFLGLVHMEVQIGSEYPWTAQGAPWPQQRGSFLL